MVLLFPASRACIYTISDYGKIIRSLTIPVNEMRYSPRGYRLQLRNERASLVHLLVDSKIIRRHHSRYWSSLTKRVRSHFDRARPLERPIQRGSRCFLFSELFYKESCSSHYGYHTYYRGQCTNYYHWKFWHYARSSNYDIVFAVCVGEGHDCID